MFIIVVGKRSAEQLLTRVMRSNDFLIRALRSPVRLTICLAKSTAFPKRILIIRLEEFRSKIKVCMRSEFFKNLYFFVIPIRKADSKLTL